MNQKKPTKEALKKLRRYQGVYMALGVGLLVGLAVRFFGILDALLP